MLDSLRPHRQQPTRLDGRYSFLSEFLQGSPAHHWWWLQLLMIVTSLIHWFGRKYTISHACHLLFSPTVPSRTSVHVSKHRNPSLSSCLVFLAEGVSFSSWDGHLGPPLWGVRAWTLEESPGSCSRHTTCFLKTLGNLTWTSVSARARWGYYTGDTMWD